MASRSVATIETRYDNRHHNDKDSCGIWLWFCGEEEEEFDDATLLQGSTVGESTLEGTTVGTLDRDDDSISEFSLDFASIGFGPMSKLNEREKQFRDYFLGSNSSEDDGDESATTRSSTHRLHMHKAAQKQNEKKQEENREGSVVTEIDAKETPDKSEVAATKSNAREAREAQAEMEDVEANNYCNCFPSAATQAPITKQKVDKVGEVVESKPIMEALAKSTREMKRLHELEKRQRNAKNLVSTLLKEANAKLQADCEQQLEQRDPEEESDIDESSHGSIKLRLGDEEGEDKKEEKQEATLETRTLDPTPTETPAKPLETPHSPQPSTPEEDGEVNTSLPKVASPTMSIIGSTSTMQEPIDPTPRGRYMKLSELRRAVHELSRGASGHGGHEGHYEYEPAQMLSLEDPVEPYLAQSRSDQVMGRGYYGMHGNPPPPMEERRYMPRTYHRQGEYHQPRRFQSSPEEWQGQAQAQVQARSPSPMRRNYEPVYYEAEQEFEQMGYAIPHWRGSMRPNQAQSVGPYGRHPPTHGYHYDTAGYGAPRMAASPPRMRRDYHGVGHPQHYRGSEFDEHSAYFPRQPTSVSESYKRGYDMASSAYHRQYSSPSGRQRSMYAAPRDIDRIQEYSAQGDDFHHYDMMRSEQLPASVQLQMGARIARQESEKLALAARDFKRRVQNPERGIPAHS